MKKVVLALLLLSTLFSAAHAAHGQLIFMQTHYFTNDLPTAIALQPVKNSLSDMVWDENKKVLSIQEDGVYEFITIVQYGIKEEAKAGGSMYYWLEVNDKPLPETMKLVSVPLQTKTNLVRFDSALSIKAGSKIQVMFSSASTDIGLLSLSSASSGCFSIASVSMSVFKIGNIVTYL